jgi:hypothetical protein
MRAHGGDHFREISNNFTIQGLGKSAQNQVTVMERVSLAVSGSPEGARLLETYLSCCGLAIVSVGILREKSNGIPPEQIHLPMQRPCPASYQTINTSSGTERTVLVSSYAVSAFHASGDCSHFY